MKDTATSSIADLLVKAKPKDDGMTATSEPRPETEPSPTPVSENETETEEVVTNETEVEVENDESRETEVDEVVTSETETDVDEGDDEVWFKNEELGIIYKDDAEAKRGLEAKEKYIQKLKDELEKKDSKLIDLETALQEQPTSTENTIEAKVQDLLPDEYKGKTEEDFLEPDELKDFIVAKAKAEAQAQVTLEREKQEALNRKELAKKRREDALEYIKQKREENFFGIKNSEDVEVLEGVLNKEVEVDGQVYTPLTLAVMAHEVDPYFADVILNGLRSIYRDGRKQEVAKYVKNTKTNVRKKAEKPASKTPNLEGRDMINHILAKRNLKP